jgi:hypothetical protein
MDCPACSQAIPNSTPTCPFCHKDLATFSRERAAERWEGPLGPKQKSSGGGRFPSSLILAGVILGALGCLSLFAIISQHLSPYRDPAKGPRCKLNLKRIALALRDYHDTWGSFPPAVTYSTDGRPMHSWRVLVLPFLDQNSLYDWYNFKDPWNSPANSAVTASMPMVFACPQNHEGALPGHTHYVALEGPQTVMNSKQPSRMQDILDGPNNTILLVEARSSQIHWAEPKDFDISQATGPAPNGMSSFHTGGFQAALADGSLRFLRESVGIRWFKGASTVNGGEQLNLLD